MDQTSRHAMMSLYGIHGKDGCHAVRLGVRRSEVSIRPHEQSVYKIMYVVGKGRLPFRNCAVRHLSGLREEHLASFEYRECILASSKVLVNMLGLPNKTMPYESLQIRGHGHMRCEPYIRRRTLGNFVS